MLSILKLFLNEKGYAIPIFIGNNNSINKRRRKSLQGAVLLLYPYILLYY